MVDNGVEASISTAHAHSGTYSLAETGAGTVYQDINGLEPGRTYTLSAWVSGSPGTPRHHAAHHLQPNDNSAVSSPVATATSRMAAGVDVLHWWDARARFAFIWRAGRARARSIGTTSIFLPRGNLVNMSPG